MPYLSNQNMLVNRDISSVNAERSDAHIFLNWARIDLREPRRGRKKNMYRTPQMGPHGSSVYPSGFLLGNRDGFFKKPDKLCVSKSMVKMDIL